MFEGGRLLLSHVTRTDVGGEGAGSRHRRCRVEEVGDVLSGRLVQVGHELVELVDLSPSDLGHLPGCANTQLIVAGE